MKNAYIQHAGMLSWLQAVLLMSTRTHKQESWQITSTQPCFSVGSGWLFSKTFFLADASCSSVHSTLSLLTTWLYYPVWYITEEKDLQVFMWNSLSCDRSGKEGQNETQHGDNIKYTHICKSSVRRRWCSSVEPHEQIQFSNTIEILKSGCISYSECHVCLIYVAKKKITNLPLKSFLTVWLMKLSIFKASLKRRKTCRQTNKIIQTK